MDPEKILEDSMSEIFRYYDETRKNTIWSTHEDYDLCMDEYNGSWEALAQDIEDWHDVERENLDRELGTGIVVLARLSTRYPELYGSGPRYAYKELEGNLNKVLDAVNEDQQEVYCDPVDVCIDFADHDGGGTAVLRAWKPGVSETRKGNFLQKFCSGRATRMDLCRYTTSLRKPVCDVYGWS